MPVSAIIDLIIAAALLLFAYLGWKRGLIRTLSELLVVVLALFLANQIANFAAPEVVDKVLEAFMNQIQEAGVVDETGELSVFALLMNNWRAMLISAAYGFVPFLFLPAISLVTNGVLLGMLGALFMVRGMSLLAYLTGIVPHGVFEIPALIFSIACGVHLCRAMNQLVTSHPDRAPLPAVLEGLLRVMVVAPLTVAAAFTECYVTPVIMSLFL